METKINIKLKNGQEMYCNFPTQCEYYNEQLKHCKLFRLPMRFNKNNPIRIEACLHLVDFIEGEQGNNG